MTSKDIEITSNAAAWDRRSPQEVVKSVVIYYAIACGFTWITWLPLVLGPDGLKLHNHPISLPISACIGTLGPLIACFATHRLFIGNWHAVRLLPSSLGRSIWVVLGPLLVLLCFFFIFPALITKGGPSAWHWKISALSGIWIQMFNYNLLGGPLFEEFGWRGFLQPRVQQILPPWLAAFVIGIMWAAWHLPLFVVTWSSATPLRFTFILIGLAVLIALAFNASGKAVVVTILMHSAFNASSGFLPSFLGAVPTRDFPSADVLVGYSFALAAVVAILLTRGQLLLEKRA